MICVQGDKGDTHLKNRFLDSVGEVGGMIWENSIETHTLTYVKQTASEGLMSDTGDPKAVLWDNLEGRGEEEGGGGCRREGLHVCPWLIHADVQQRPSQYCKVISLQLK